MTATHKTSTGTAPIPTAEEIGWVTLTVKPARLPFRVAVSSWLLAIIPGILVGIYTAMQAPRSGGLFLVTDVLAWIVSGWIVNRLYATYHNARRRVQTHPFQVSTMGIRTPAGDLIPVGQVYAVKLGNAQSGRSIAFVGAGIAAGVALMGAATLDRLATVSYTVEVEHGGQETVLAGGLTEAHARAVCAEVLRRLAENT
jgi:hypothetical protein